MRLYRYKVWTQNWENILGNSTLPMVTIDPVLLLKINPDEQNAVSWAAKVGWMLTQCCRRHRARGRLPSWASDARWGLTSSLGSSPGPLSTPTPQRSRRTWRDNHPMKMDHHSLYSGWEMEACQSTRTLSGREEETAWTEGGPWPACLLQLHFIHLTYDWIIIPVYKLGSGVPPKFLIYIISFLLPSRPDHLPFSIWCLACCFSGNKYHRKYQQLKKMKMMS